MNNRYTICGICGAPGHGSKSCPLYRLNEKQTVIAGSSKVIAKSGAKS